MWTLDSLELLANHLRTLTVRITDEDAATKVRDFGKAYQQVLDEMERVKASFQAPPMGSGPLRFSKPGGV